MEFRAVVQGHKLVYSTIQQSLRARYFAGLKDGVLIKETLVKDSCPKSHQQIKAIFGLIIAKVLQEFEDRGWDSSTILNIELPTGIPISKELLKEFFYVVCPIYNDEGKKITLSKASIEQAMKFIDETRNWSAIQWRIYIPDPDPNWRTKHCKVKT